MLLFFINWKLEIIGDKLYPKQKWESAHKGLAAMEHGMESLVFFFYVARHFRTHGH
jgi:hypothetical protein